MAESTAESIVNNILASEPSPKEARAQAVPTENPEPEAPVKDAEPGKEVSPEPVDEAPAEDAEEEFELLVGEESRKLKASDIIAAVQASGEVEALRSQLDEASRSRETFEQERQNYFVEQLNVVTENTKARLDGIQKLMAVLEPEYPDAQNYENWQEYQTALGAYQKYQEYKATVDKEYENVTKAATSIGALRQSASQSQAALDQQAEIARLVELQPKLKEPKYLQETSAEVMDWLEANKVPPELREQIGTSSAYIRLALHDAAKYRAMQKKTAELKRTTQAVPPPSVKSRASQAAQTLSKSQQDALKKFQTSGKAQDLVAGLMG